MMRRHRAGSVPSLGGGFRDRVLVWQQLAVAQSDETKRVEAYHHERVDCWGKAGWAASA